MREITEEEAFKQLCENDFAFFCQQFLKVVEPETEFEWGWYHYVICNYCEQVYYGCDFDLDINIPPRMLKTLIVSVLFPCWIWTKRPSFKIISGSRSYDLSVQINIKRRGLIESDEYQSVWPIPMKHDSNTSHKFENEFNGFMQAVSAGGKITGVGADLLISDDLLDAIDAFSKSKRESVNQWFSLAFHNRVQNKKKAKRININQRLHAEDPSGHIAKNHPRFKRLVLPMQMTNKPMSTVPGFEDPRKEGEFLHPERYGPEEKDAEIVSLGSYGWSSQMQQDPRPVGGGIIKDEWIRYYKELPEKFDKKIITGDLTFKGDQDSDYVCFQCWGKIGHKLYLIDIVRGKWTYSQTKKKFKEFCDKHNASSKWIEDKANGPALLDDLKDEIKGLKAWPRKGSKYVGASKVQRLHLASNDWENGNCYLPEGIPLVDLFVEELTSFTEKGSTTGNDDMVDTSTMAILEIKTQTFFAEA